MRLYVGSLGLAQLRSEIQRGVILHEVVCRELGIGTVKK